MWTGCAWNERPFEFGSETHSYYQDFRQNLHLMPSAAQVEVESRAELRAWLEANAETSAGVWLVSYKKIAGERYLPYSELVEEVLCFGWIDSLPRKLDELRSQLYISPRKPGSAWSGANKLRIEQMRAAGLMRPAGLAQVTMAKANGKWDFLNDVEAGVVPDDLAEAFAAVPGAAEQFAAFPLSARSGILQWIKQAKGGETRRKRVLETAEKAGVGVRANAWVGK